jgi:hypothetical protein
MESVSPRENARGVERKYGKGRIDMQRHFFDPNQPQGSMSLENLRNALRGLFQGDLMGLRPRASMVIDDMEYPSNALAQAEWAGTGVTVSKSTTKNEGNYAIQSAIDVTGSRQLEKEFIVDLSRFVEITAWHRCDGISQVFRFYVEDSSGNLSYWVLTSHGTADTWKQDIMTLASPDGNNGTAAVLSDVIKCGFYQLPASQTFLFDTIKALSGLNVAVEGSEVAGFYRQVYLGVNNVDFAGGPSPVIVPPGSNPRIDLLVLTFAGVLEWVTGAEASTPVEPTFPTDKIPVCLIYCRPTMAKVVDFEEADANPNEGYIYKDVRPVFSIQQLTIS